MIFLSSNIVCISSIAVDRDISQGSALVRLSFPEGLLAEPVKHAKDFVNINLMTLYWILLVLVL